MVKKLSVFFFVDELIACKTQYFDNSLIILNLLISTILNNYFLIDYLREKPIILKNVISFSVFSETKLNFPQLANFIISKCSKRLYIIN